MWIISQRQIARQKITSMPLLKQTISIGCINARGSKDFMVVNRKTGDFITAPELMPHLISIHHFFEGTETPFRTDPERLVNVLGIKKMELQNETDNNTA